jgi:hypothetical protein
MDGNCRADPWFATWSATWSARVPLDSLFVQPHQPHAIHKRPTGGSAADQGVRPTPKDRMAAI